MMNIAVDCLDREEAWDWAKANGIDIQYHNTVKDNNILKDVWRVENEQDCVLFALRWA